MAAKPDYDTLRNNTAFTWSIGSSYDTLITLADIPIREYNLNPEAGIEAYRKGRPMIREYFGQDVTAPFLCTPHVSYGHINCLGAKLNFPVGGEVCPEVLYGSLEEGVSALKNPVDFETAGMTQFYADYSRKLSEAFDGEQCYFAFGYEGPITTAYTLRGHGVFLDPSDNPSLFKEFLQLLTESIVQFARFHCRINGYPEYSEEGAGLCDDVASMFSPDAWPEFVLPYWEQYYTGRTSGSRFAHVEDLRKEQLHFLEKICLLEYDPSISPKLNPKIIRDNCRVPFSWRLGSFYYPQLSCSDIRDFVFQAVCDGACKVFTDAESSLCNEAGVQKLQAFADAAREVEKMLAEGADRAEIGNCVSKEGKAKFWDKWPL